MEQQFKAPEKFAKNQYSKEEVYSILEKYIEQNEANTDHFKLWQKKNNFAKQEAIFVSIDEFLFNNKL